jgi:hypothetical protein
MDARAITFWSFMAAGMLASIVLGYWVFLRA